ncbi:MAG TPA: hypothetical protein EYP98_07985 [Planctomycetes bacterium]|nr:hypothetical protein [Planctomycetota bacterium]
MKKRSSEKRGVLPLIMLDVLRAVEYAVARCEQPVALRACGHIFCRGCLLTALAADRRCPTCRAAAGGAAACEAWRGACLILFRENSRNENVGAVLA